MPDSYLSFIKKVGSGDETNLMAEVCRCLGFEKTHTAVSDYSFHCEVYRPNDFPFQNWSISISHFNKFHLTANYYRFRCILAIFHTKIMLVL